jgi:hypothetical protein
MPKRIKHVFIAWKGFTHCWFESWLAQILIRKGSSYDSFMSPDPMAVLITGAYGTGKSAVIEELAGILEASGVAFAMLDLDYLWWFAVNDLDGASHKDLLWANLSALVANYSYAGVDHFLLAWAVEDKEDLDALGRTMAMPMSVVTLSVPLEVIRHRLSTSPTTDRQKDLQNSEQWFVENTGEDLNGFVVDNDRNLRVVANEILDLIGWT